MRLLWRYTPAVHHDDAEDRPYVPRLMSRRTIVTVSLVLLTIFVGPYLLTLAFSVREATRDRVDPQRASTDAEYLAECLETMWDEGERLRATLFAYDLIGTAPIQTQRRIVRAWIERGSGVQDSRFPTFGFLIVHRAGLGSRATLLDELVRGLLSPTVDRTQLAHAICSMYSNADPRDTGFPRIEFPGCDTNPPDDRAINVLATYLIEWRTQLEP